MLLFSHCRIVEWWGPSLPRALLKISTTQDMPWDLLAWLLSTVCYCQNSRCLALSVSSGIGYTKGGVGGLSFFAFIIVSAHSKGSLVWATSGGSPMNTPWKVQVDSFCQA